VLFEADSTFVRLNSCINKRAIFSYTSGLIFKQFL